MLTNKGISSFLKRGGGYPYLSTVWFWTHRMKVHIPVLKNRSKMTENVDCFWRKKAVWTDSDNLTVRQRHVASQEDLQDAPHDQISHFWSVPKQNPIAVEAKTIFFSNWKILCDCFKNAWHLLINSRIFETKARHPVRSCLAFVSN